jgi:hypothetical protein
VSPYSTDYAADDRSWRPGDKEARSRAKRGANSVGSRIGGRKSDECGHEHCLARDRKRRASAVPHEVPPQALHVENLKAHDCGDFVASEARSLTARARALAGTVTSAPVASFYGAEQPGSSRANIPQR